MMNKKRSADKGGEDISQEAQAKIDEAKAEGHVVFALKLAGVRYIYRSINREEFRVLQQQLADEAEEVRLEAIGKKKGLEEDDPRSLKIDAGLEKKAIEIRESGEERLVLEGLLYPEFTQNTPAGVPRTIADRIMEASAFGSDEEPEML
jgi:hypothetical protein